MNLLLSGLLLATVGLARSAPWTPVDAGLPSRPLGVSAIVPDPNDSSTLYAITNLRSLYKSVDGAATWRSVGGIVGVLSLAIDPSNSATLYVGSDRGMLKSTDAGQTWSLAITGIDTSMFFPLAITVDPIDTATVYVINGAGPFRLLKTTDGAANWKTVYSFASAAGPIVLDPVTPSTLYTGQTDGAILKSTDGGLSWNQIKDGGNVGSSPYDRALAIDPRNPFILYAGSFTNSALPVSIPIRPGAGAIAKSTDGGQTWRIIRTGIPTDAYVRVLDLDPSDPSILYAAYTSNNGAGVLRSADTGESWTQGYTISGSFSVTVAIGPGEVLTAYAGTTEAGLVQSLDAVPTGAARIGDCNTPTCVCWRLTRSIPVQFMPAVWGGCSGAPRGTQRGGA
jgi:photosystem II stability/assembly factor-like uncharacterized protein